LSVKVNFLNGKSEFGKRLLYKMVFKG